MESPLELTTQSVHMGTRCFSEPSIIFEGKSCSSLLSNTQWIVKGITKIHECGQRRSMAVRIYPVSTKTYHWGNLYQLLDQLGECKPLVNLLELSWFSINLLISIFSSNFSNSSMPLGKTSTKKSKRLLISRTTAFPCQGSRRL